MTKQENVDECKREISRLKEENRRYRTVMDNLSIHERMFHTLFESGHDAVLLLEGQIIRDSNMRSTEVFQYSQEELLGLDILTLSPLPNSEGESRERLVEYFDETSLTGTHFFEWTFRRRNGVEFPVEVSLASFAMNATRYYIASIRDISLQKEIEKDLRTRTAQLQSTLESLPFDFWMNDTFNRTLLQNSYSKELWGNTHGKHMEMVTDDETIKSSWRDSNRRALAGEVVEREISYIVDGDQHIYRNIVAPIRDEKRVIGILGLNIEVTDYKRTQERVQEALKEREILLREIHHRVKNNLQIIVSMINLQKITLSESERVALMEIENRINSMALIHDQLYNSNKLDTIFMPDYMESLADSILSAFDLHNEGPELEIDVEEISLSLEAAIPLAIITNELITNSVKHAFTGTSWGQISLSLKKLEREEAQRRENETSYRLEIRDNGVGVKHEDQSEVVEGGLGLTLVDQLSRQIGGEVKYSTEGGFSTTLTFSSTDG